jgi:integrase
VAKPYTNDYRKPETLSQLLRKAAEPLWGHCAAYKLCIGNVEEAIKILDNPRLDAINTVVVDDYIRVIQDGRSPGTVNRKMSSLRAILKYAYDRDWIIKLPKFNWKKEDEHRTRWLSEDEEAELLSLLPEDVAAFVTILIDTGMRRGELLTMKREQLQGDYVRLWKTKNGKARSVPLTDRAKGLLDKHLPFDLTTNRLRWCWNHAKKQMGLVYDKEFVLHACRHTRASRLLQSTGNLVMVQKMLGHSKITTTTRYAHIADEQLLEAIRKEDKKR